jgi:ATP adenylyltransferase
MAEKPRACIFCEALARRDEESSLIVHEGKSVFTILNRYPYANGHVMVAPRAHEARLSESPPETLLELVREVSLAQDVLQEAYRPAGFNVGANFGRAGGAGVEDHYHFHVVPRWIGDVNFMNVTADTRVVPEELPVTRARLAAGFAELAGREDP